jgi:hypothetical protein
MSTIGTLLGRYENVVAAALLEHDESATLNSLSARCGGSISMTSQALTSLEEQGCARFDAGRWYAITSVARPEQELFARGEIATARRVRQRAAANNRALRAAQSHD